MVVCPAMARGHFMNLLERQWDRGAFLCVGLDPVLKQIPESVEMRGAGETILAFNKAIIDATYDIAGSYKPNSAFYEAYGDDGLRALKETVRYIHEKAPETPVILDAKRADIGNTNNGYVQAAFDNIGADAITVHPYLGSEALEPFLKRADKGIIVLARTSNKGAGEIQDIAVDGEPLYMRVAKTVASKWNGNKNCCLVVGATYPEELKKIRSAVGDMPILIPGVGAQGGDLEQSVLYGRNAKNQGIMLAVSRAIIFASAGADFTDAVRAKAQEFDSAIRHALVQ